jgi:hypothetical protein
MCAMGTRFQKIGGENPDIVERNSSDSPTSDIFAGATMSSIDTRVWRTTFAVASLTMWIVSSSGCSSAAKVDDLPETETLRIVLDANARSVAPGRQLKFFVDVHNETRRTIDVNGIDIELIASPRPDPAKISLRKSWSYNWRRDVTLAPGKRITLPIVPESRNSFNRQLGQTVEISEFPLHLLRPGEYEIRARVNERFVSRPYVLRVHPVASYLGR